MAADLPGWTPEGLSRLASAIDRQPQPEAQVGGCCGEWNCRRKTPIGIYRGNFTGQVFAATSMHLVKDHGDGTATFSASVKHDITRQVKAFIRANAEWVREVLEASDGR